MNYTDLSVNLFDFLSLYIVDKIERVSLNSALTLFLLTWGFVFVSTRLGPKNYICQNQLWINISL